MTRITLGTAVIGKPEFVRPELLTHPPIPAALAGLNPRTIMGQAKWDVVRQEVYQENNYCCWACGIHKSRAWRHFWLEAHETYAYNEAARVARLNEIVALCQRCHMFVHANNLIGSIDWSRDEVSYIVHSGFLLLDAHGLVETASNTNKYILWMYDSALYAILFDGGPPEARMSLSQFDWSLVWEGYEWTRVADRIRCRPAGSDEQYVRCERGDDGMLYAGGE